MYNTTSQFIANARALKTALLTCLLVNESLRIETGSAGAVPCVLDKPKPHRPEWQLRHADGACGCSGTC